MVDVPVKQNPVPPYILNPDATGSQFSELTTGFIGRLAPGDMIQHVGHTHKNSPYEEFIDQGQLNIARSPVVRVLEEDKAADAKSPIGLLIGSQLDESKPNSVATLKVPSLGDGHDFEKASSDKLLYALMIKAVKELNLPQPDRIYPMQIQGSKEEGYYLKFATISDALAFRQAASDGKIGNLMKEGLREFHQQYRELKDAIGVEDIESLVEATMKAQNFEDHETGTVKYRLFRPYANQEKAKTQMNKEWSRKTAEPEEALALKICQMHHIDGVDIHYAEAIDDDAKTKQEKLEYGVAYHFNSLEDIQQFAHLIREPLTVKAAMEAVRDDLKRGVSKMPDKIVDADQLAHLGDKLASAGKAGHVIN